MFSNEDSRFSVLAAASLAAIVLAVLGHWAFGGFIGGGFLVVAVLVNIVGTLFAPHVPRSFYNAAPFFFGAVATLVALIVGVITFGWWGIAYAVGALVGYLLSSATR
jgi:hypothetical protein